MAVRNIKEKTVLKLELDNGIVDEKQRVSTITYSKIRTTATDEQMYNTGVAIQRLQKKNLLGIKRAEEMLLASI